MSKVLSTKELDQIASQGCTVKGCTHDHDGIVYLHARCHLKAQVVLQRLRDALEIRCAACNKLVAEVLAEDVGVPYCHPNDPVEVEYTTGRKTLRIVCHRCKKELAFIPVKDN